MKNKIKRNEKEKNKINDGRNRNHYAHPQVVMLENINLTTFPSLLHGNETIIRKLFYFILQRSY